jgi:hypothetical protein
MKMMEFLKEGFVKEMKIQIDEMTYDEMVDKYKNSSVGDPMFLDPIGQYFAEQMEIKRRKHETE